MTFKVARAKIFSSLISLLNLSVLSFLFLYPGTSYALNQDQITAAMSPAWNVGNQLEANNQGIPNEEMWGNPKITPQLIALVKSSGFKSFRIPVSYLSKIGAAPNYTIDSAWIARVKEVVDYVISAGLYAIINIHGDGYHTITGGWLLVTDNNQTAIKEKFGKVWQQIATTFQSYDEHLVFESMNEVFDGNFYDPDPKLYPNLNAYNQVFVDAVRKTGGNNASRWLLIPGWNTTIDYTAGDFGFALPTDNFISSSVPAGEKRIMISVHYYTPWEFCGDQSNKITQWGKVATDTSKFLAWSHEPYMESQMSLMYYSFFQKGYPVVVGEWGSIDKTKYDPANNTCREHFAKSLVSFCKQYKLIPAYWDNGHNGDYGIAILDRKTFKITQQGIINGIMSGMNNTAPPGPAPKPVPIVPVPTGPGAKISVLYKCGAASDSSGQISFSLQVQNDDTMDINLKNVTLRYWYTRDDGKWQGFHCYYAVLGADSITGNMVRIPLSHVKPTIDFYTDIGFKNGTGILKPGANSGELQITMNKYDNSKYYMKNDFSFNPAMTTFTQNTKITGYVNGTLSFGEDPYSGITPIVKPLPSPKTINADGDRIVVLSNLQKDNNTLHINFKMQESSQLEVSAYNLHGKKVWTNGDKTFSTGNHVATWSIAKIPTGLYVIELRTAKNNIRKLCMVSH